MVAGGLIVEPEGRPGEGESPHLGRLIAVAGRFVWRDAVRLRPIAEWHEDFGPVLWWRLPIDEPPYVGTPLDMGREVVIAMRTVGHCYASVPLDRSPNAPKPVKVSHPGGKISVGGWPGYHTHWTPLIIPPSPPEDEA